MKSDGEIVEIRAAFDLTGSARSAAELVGCSHHTVAAHVAARDAGRAVGIPARRSRNIDGFLDKIEEWVEASKGKIRADKAHEKLEALGFGGSDRSTRRAVAEVKKAYRLGHARVHRPWVTEPGMWLQYDFGDGPSGLSFAARSSSLLSCFSLPPPAAAARDRVEGLTQCESDRHKG